MDNIFVLVIVIILGIIFYFIPAIIGSDKKQSTGIFLLNLFLGWTVLGWVGSLVWSVSSPKKEKFFTYSCDKCGNEQKFTKRLKLFVCQNCQTSYQIDDEEESNNSWSDI